MNLREERNWQKLMDVLDVLELSPDNRRLAEEYLDPAREEDRELLKGAVKQDFSKLDWEKRTKSAEYMEHLKKRNHMEELERYMRLMAAVGGSTAAYVFEYYLYSSLSCLSEEQAAAIHAERVAWDIYSHVSSMADLFKAGRENPEVLYKARKLCYDEFGNAEVLLTAVYLFSVRAEKERAETWVQEAVGFLEKNLIDSLPALFPSPRPAKEDLKELVDFIQGAEKGMPLTEGVLTLIRGKVFEHYLIALLTGAAFLAIDYSGVMLGFVRVAAAMDLEVALSACQAVSRNESYWFKEHLEYLEEVLPVPREDYIRWCLKSKQHNALRRMAARHPESYSRAAEGSSITTEQYEFLLEQAKEGNASLYRRMRDIFEAGYQKRLSHELLEGMPSGAEEALGYLLGERALEALYPFVNSWRSGFWHSYCSYDKLEKQKKSNPPIYAKGVVLLALEMRGSYFNQHYFTLIANKDRDGYWRTLKEEVKGLIELFEREGLPVSYQADALGSIYESTYNSEWKAHFMDAAVEALAAIRNGRMVELREAAGLATTAGRGICIRVLDHFWQEEKETLLSCAMDSSKQVREVLVAVVAVHREWEPEIRSMLASGKSQERELAIQAMKKWGVENYQEELTRALEKEKSRKLKELLQDCLGREEMGAGESGKKGVQELAVELLKGGKARKVAWAYETPFSEVCRKDGSPAEEKYLQALLVSYADKTVPGISTEGAKLAAELNQEELARFMSELFAKWLESGAEAKKKWVLYAFSIHGGNGALPVLMKQIQEWPQHARGAMAAEAVRAMAFNGGSQALMQVDQISRKFKFRQVKAAAAEALEAAASALGISRAQLEDRIVPNLGFDESLKRTFDYGTRSFQVYLTPTLELEIFDEEEKRLKNLPAPGKRDEEEKAAAAYAEFKALKKLLKTVTANQKLRLEQALSAERLWSTDQWKELFVKNPVMHQFAIGLVWGIYEEGKLKETFRYMEDGSFNTREEEELELPEGSMIGLVHPIELSEKELGAWREQLSDYEITQPIEQLERPVYRMTGEEREAKELARFGGKVLNGLSLSGKLQGMGWYRGPVEDGGVYMTFYREDEKLGAEVEFSGCFVGDENEEITVYGVTFYRGKVRAESYVDHDSRKKARLALGEVESRYFSEIVLQLHRATASSQEQLAYPECSGQSMNR